VNIFFQNFIHYDVIPFPELFVYCIFFTDIIRYLHYVEYKFNYFSSSPHLIKVRHKKRFQTFFCILTHKWNKENTSE